MYMYILQFYKQSKFLPGSHLLLSSTQIESQKGTITIQRMFLWEPLKGSLYHHIAGLDSSQWNIFELLIVQIFGSYIAYNLVSQPLQTSQLFAYMILNLSSAILQPTILYL